MNFPMIALLCFVCCLFSCRVTKDRRTLTEIVVMGKTYKRRSKLLEATALEIVVTDTGNTALKLEVPGCKDYVALRLNRHEVKKFKEALIACGNEPMVVTLLQYRVNGKHCYILYHEPSKNDSHPEFDGAKEDTLKTNCRTACNIAFVLYGFSLILYPLAWWISVITIVAASLLIYLNIPLLDDELWFDSCEFIKRPKQVKGKNSVSDVVASQASIILEEISEKYQDKGKSDKDYEQYQEEPAETPDKEPPRASGKVEAPTSTDNKEPVNVKVNIHTEINPEPSEFLDVLADESEPIVPPAPKAASTPQNADAVEPFDVADIFEPEPEQESEPKIEKESVFDLPVDDDDTQDPFAEEDSDSPSGLSFDPSGIDMDDDEKDPFADDDSNVFNPPDDVDEHEEELDTDMMGLDVPASYEPATVDSPALEQKSPAPDKVRDLPAKEANVFGTPKAVVAEPKAKPHEPAKPAESHPAQSRTVQKTDVTQTQKAESKTAPSTPAQRPKADREAALAGFNITRKVEPSKEVKKPKKPITDKRMGTSKSTPEENTSKPQQIAKEAPTKQQKKPANEKQQNSDASKKTQPFDQSFRKRGRGSSKKAQQSNGQISFEEKTSDFIKC